ncbi:MAG: diguanylate cyclase [Deltaproteobacteria bacterium]|nr:diguanylate cyclase [Deltaproteobacteria bacterium]NIS78327.1 diguanylate cyclase [Deltaproteobacteria bacterium]
MRDKVVISVNSFWPLVKSLETSLQDGGYSVLPMDYRDLALLGEDFSKNRDVYLVLVGDSGLTPGEVEGLASLKLKRFNVSLPLIFVGGMNVMMRSESYLSKGVDEILPADMPVEEAYSRIKPFLRNRHAFLDLYRVTTRLKELSLTDELTGLPNRRWFIRDLKKGFEMAKRLRAPLACIMIDIDDFKEVNDTYGHTAGDAVITQFGLVINGIKRAYDVVSRLGGDEFGWILFNSDRDKACSVVERARKIVSMHRFIVKEHQISITASFGVATFSGDGIKSHEMLIEMADKALYIAKERGKDSVVTYDAAGEESEAGDIEIS